MSTLYLGTDLDSLATKLAELHAANADDFFMPVTVAVSSPYLGKWLRMWLARKLGVVINFRFDHLERAMWEMLKTLDGRPPSPPLELLDDSDYRVMVLAALLDVEAGGEDLGPLRDYLQRKGGEPRRDFYRRAWQLADRLARLIRDYEYHRQEDLIQKWLVGNDGYPKAAPAELRLERSQRALFHLITKEPDGLRAVLSQASGKRFKTLPQYAHELMELSSGDLAKAPKGMIHLFGISQISAMHIDVLHWLGQRYDLRLYHLNPLVGRVDARSATRSNACSGLRKLAERFRISQRAAPEVNEELLHAWGHAGAESLWLMAELLKGANSFNVEVLPAAHQPQGTTLLSRLQGQLLGLAEGTGKTHPQDRSLQIVACPGIYREVETVYQSILHNLDDDDTLRQTDIAVLATDMPRYRPVIQAVFNRQPWLISYNLADFSAAGLSAFGHGLLGLLDLALESFTRSQVLAVLLNPCFLARLGVEREEAQKWLEWAETLGIYHCWDVKDKQERGYADTPLYSWQHGLRRLRLGRLMEVSDESAETPVATYKDVVPFADLDSSNKEQLDVFCRAVEGLLPALRRLRGLKVSGEAWANELRRLIETYLDVPEDRRAEAEVRDELLHSLSQLHILDQLGKSAQALPLALIREFVLANLEGVAGRRGEFLTGGVTIAALLPLRPIPFRIIYVLGLGEGLFPGSDVLSSFDLRALKERHPGDIRPAESNRFLLLEALLAAKEKIYLLYNNRDLQKDQELHPCGPVSQLSRSLASKVTGNKFEITNVPLRGSDPKLLGHENKEYSDVLLNYNETDRLLALEEAQQNGALKLDAQSAAEIKWRLTKAQPDFQLPANTVVGDARIPTVNVWELRSFLRCPAEAALKRHLHLADEEDPEAVDDEPFYTAFPHDYRLVTKMLRDFIDLAVQGNVQRAVQAWPQRFAQLYHESRLRCQLPDGAFAKVDHARFEQNLRERIEGANGLAEFLKERQTSEFCGPVLLGESITPVGARQRFPALKLYLPPEVRIVGSFPLAWRSTDAFEMLMITTSAGNDTSRKGLNKYLLEPVLFFLAMKAGKETLEGVSSADWLAERSLRVHISYGDGIKSFEYTREDISHSEARAYLSELVGDFLNRRGFELLPFDLIVSDKELMVAYSMAEGAGEMEQMRSSYTEQLQDACDEDQEKAEFAKYQLMDLVRVIDAKVPVDAFDKVRRRFRLLDRGPARLREQKGGD